jgi:hypothetical protein
MYAELLNATSVPEWLGLPQSMVMGEAFPTDLGDANV